MSLVETRPRSFRQALCLFMAGVCGVTITLFGLLLLDRRPVLTLGPSAIVPNPAHAGQMVSVVWSAIEHRNCAGEVRRVVTDSSGVRHEFKPEATAYHDAMDNDKRTFARQFRIPRGVAAGPATYHSIITRWCNPIQQMWPMVERSPTAHFTVAD